jgi:hypothetical protein
MAVKAGGWLGIINGSKLHIDFSKQAFDEAFNLLIREIESVRISLGIDGNYRTNSKSHFLFSKIFIFILVSPYFNNNHSITTMTNSWSHFQNVNEWNADDVIEWLNHEKLEM